MSPGVLFLFPTFIGYILSSYNMYVYIYDMFYTLYMPISIIHLCMYTNWFMSSLAGSRFQSLNHWPSGIGGRLTRPLLWIKPSKFNFQPIAAWPWGWRLRTQHCHRSWRIGLLASVISETGKKYADGCLNFRIWWWMSQSDGWQPSIGQQPDLFWGNHDDIPSQPRSSAWAEMKQWVFIVFCPLNPTPFSVLRNYWYLEFDGWITLRTSKWQASFQVTTVGECFGRQVMMFNL